MYCVAGAEQYNAKQMCILLAQRIQLKHPIITQQMIALHKLNRKHTVHTAHTDLHTVFFENAHEIVRVDFFLIFLFALLNLRARPLSFSLFNFLSVSLCLSQRAFNLKEKKH